MQDDPDVNWEPNGNYGTFRPKLAAPPPVRGWVPVPPPPLTGRIGPSDEEVAAARQKAIIALALGIANFIICGFLCIPALILANQALAVFREAEYLPPNTRGFAIAARVLGIIGIVWMALLMLLWIAAVVIPHLIP